MLEAGRNRRGCFIAISSSALFQLISGSIIASPHAQERTVFLVYVGRPTRNIKGCLSASERFGAKLHGNEILRRCREALIRSHIIEEVLDIPREIRHGAGSNEAENFHAAVVAHVQAPGATPDVHRRFEASDGVDAAVAPEPDHQLVVAAGSGVVDVCCGEEVVGDVRADVGVADGPDGCSGD
jgi:hypothetical protein